MNRENPYISRWLARVERLLDDGSLDCVEQGYLLVPAGLQNLAEADPTSAVETFSRACAIGERFGDLLHLGHDRPGAAASGTTRSRIWRRVLVRPSAAIRDGPAPRRRR